jgi:hypothetical protein
VDGEAARGPGDELLKGETTVAEATRRYGFGPSVNPSSSLSPLLGAVSEHGCC